MYQLPGHGQMDHAPTNRWNGTAISSLALLRAGHYLLDLAYVASQQVWGLVRCMRCQTFLVNTQ